MTTYIISEVIAAIAKYGKEERMLTLYYDKYKLDIYYNCITNVVYIKSVQSGAYMSNNYEFDLLPEDFNEDLFEEVVKLVMAERMKEIKRKEEEEREELEREESERTYRYKRDTEDYLRHIC